MIKRSEQGPSELDLMKSRAISDGELFQGGSHLVSGETNGLRLEITEQQRTDLSRQGPKPEIEKLTDVQEHLDWVTIHPYQYLSFIIEQYGSLEEFERRAQMRAQKRIEQMQEADHKRRKPRAA